MQISLFESFLQRIKDATTFAQLVEMDAELDNLKASSKLESILYLKEEIELRGNPTVYTALGRMHQAGQAAFLDPASPEENPLDILEDLEEDDLQIDVIGHLSGQDPLQSARLGDEEHIDKMVDNFTKKMAPQPFDESANMGMAGLIKQPGFLEAIQQAEKEERGEFPDQRPIFANILQAISNTADPDDIDDILAKNKKTGVIGELTAEEKETLARNIQERLGVLAGANNNAQLIQRIREARSMGVTLNDLIQIRGRMAQKEAPLLFRSFLETIRDETKELSELLEDGATGEELTPEALMRLQERISEGINQRLRDKKNVENFLDSLNTPPEPPKNPGPTI